MALYFASKLDKLWHEVNSLAGAPRCAHDHVYNQAIADVLAVIERHGGQDPLQRKAEPDDPYRNREAV